MESEALRVAEMLSNTRQETRAATWRISKIPILTHKVGRKAKLATKSRERQEAYLQRIQRFKNFQGSEERAQAEQKLDSQGEKLSEETGFTGCDLTDGEVGKSASKSHRSAGSYRWGTMGKRVRWAGAPKLFL